MRRRGSYHARQYPAGTVAPRPNSRRNPARSFIGDPMDLLPRLVRAALLRPVPRATTAAASAVPEEGIALDFVRASEMDFDFACEFPLDRKGFDLDVHTPRCFGLSFDRRFRFGGDFHSYYGYHAALLFLLFLLLMSYSSRLQTVRTYSFAGYLPRNSADHWPQFCVHPPQICGHPVEIS